MANLYEANEKTVTEFVTSKEVKSIIEAHIADSSKDNTLFKTVLPWFIPLMSDIYNYGKIMGKREERNK